MMNLSDLRRLTRNLSDLRRLTRNTNENEHKQFFRSQKIDTNISDLMKFEINNNMNLSDL